MRLIYWLLLFFLTSKVLALDTVCHPTLWPNDHFTLSSTLSESNQQVIKYMQKKARKALSESSHPIPFLSSAGKTSINDTRLLLSRLAFRDSDRAALLALSYTLNHDPAYLNSTKNILINWALINHPTGNPIDETRLEGMIWAYDLIRCDLTAKENTVIYNWFEKMRTQKLSWKFGPRTRINNHRIHQMKMILLLDKVLGHTEAWQRDLAQTTNFAKLNLNSISGESIDYKERNALHYHNFDLQAWLEISLISGCCRESITPAFNFLRDRIQAHHLDGEFLHSSAKIDGLRAKGGFQYAKTGGIFDVSKAGPTIVTYYTIVPNTPAPDLWQIVESCKYSPWLAFILNRRIFWQSSKT